MYQQLLALCYELSLTRPVPLAHIRGAVRPLRAVVPHRARRGQQSPFKVITSLSRTHSSHNKSEQDYAIAQ